MSDKKTGVRTFLKNILLFILIVPIAFIGISLAWFVFIAMPAGLLIDYFGAEAFFIGVVVVCFCLKITEKHRMKYRVYRILKKNG